MGTYKDLVLCCATKYEQRDYFVCNPITKQWIALPPTPQIYECQVNVAFVCDPYYYDGAELQEKQNITSAAKSPSTVINAEYTWKVVRLVPNSRKGNFNVEIFSSKTRKWRELVVLRSRPIQSMFDGLCSAVAYKGMLYWCGSDGIIFELDLEDNNYHNYNRKKKKNKNIAKCRLIRLPEGADVSGLSHLVVSEGRLRLYTHILVSHGNQERALRAWELHEVVKDDRADNKFEFKWLVDSVPLTVHDENMCLYEIPLVVRNDRHWFEVLHFHQHNEDIIYFKSNPYLATGNIRGGRLEICTKIEYKGITSYSYPFLFPWWPTPVHI